MTEFDAAVVGAGFYGCKVAAQLAKLGQSVVLLETEAGPMRRASRWNQARVHHGYHYPRHTLTAMSSAKNYAKFLQDYGDCAYKDFTHIYAIPKKGSFVSARQFSRLMSRVGLPTKVASFQKRRHFNENFFEQIFEVDEVAFDAEKLRARVEIEIDQTQIEKIYSAHITSIQVSGLQWRIRLEKPTNTEIFAKKIFNCTYSEINNVLNLGAIEKLPLKLELAELALVHLPEELTGLGVTVMDGPFFSLMPFPSLSVDGKILTSVSHVKYTPHRAWVDTLGEHHEILKHPPRSKFPEMSRAISFFIPSFSKSVYQRSFWEFKTILPKNEVNDGRPILFYQHPTEIPFVSLMGGKIDNFYDLEAHVR